MSRKHIPLNQNRCTADFRIGVPFEQNLQETSKQLGKYHKRLEATEKCLIALQIVEMLPEENRSEQYGKLIDYIFENSNK